VRKLETMREVAVFATAAQSIDDALSAVVAFRSPSDRKVASSSGTAMAAAGRASGDSGGGVAEWHVSKVDPAVVESVILHGNDIQSLAGALPLPALTTLNLSSNAITMLDGSLLARFPRLATLDLSVNRISKIEGLGALTSLVSLRLAGNLLSSLDWLEAFHSPRHRLQCLDVTGNQVWCGPLSSRSRGRLTGSVCVTCLLLLRFGTWCLVCAHCPSVDI
jgi:Leucine-rich repeat (LRR) protein